MNFNSGTFLTAAQVMQGAKEQNISPILFAIRHAGGHAQSRSYWETPTVSDEINDKYPVINVGNNKDVVGKFSRSVADAIMFPRSTAYMHFLGCISAAMMGRFTVEYYDSEQPVALYIVTSQPPSTGKSAIHGNALNPIISEVERINEIRKTERKKIYSKLSTLKEELKGEKSPTEMSALMTEKDELEEKLSKLGDLVFPVSDTTPEGLARINYNQGNFAVISDEATAINSLLGMVYGSSDKKSNSELVLKAWDEGHVSIARSNAENNMAFRASGAIVVCAQDETIDSIMTAGSRGIGVSERFLLLREANMLGKRKRLDEKGNPIVKSIDKALKAEYYMLVHNIMMTDPETPVNLKLSPEAFKFMLQSADAKEQDLGDGGKYSHSMLRGAIGKMDKQVIRIAAVLHTIRNWNGSDPRHSKKIGIETMQEAIIIYEELSKTYQSSAEAAGYAGSVAEEKAVRDFIVSRAAAGKKMMSISSVYQAMLRSQVFKGQNGVAKALKERIFPKLEAEHVLCVDPKDGMVYFSPHICK